MPQWKQKRKAAQWILQEMLHNTIKDNWCEEFIVSAKGEVAVNRNGARHYFSQSQARIKYFLDKGKFPSSVIYAAIRLLLANGHIEETFWPEKSGVEETEFKATPEGIAASENDYYTNEILEKWQDWPKRNFVLVAGIAWVFGLVAIIAKDKLPSSNQEKKTSEPTVRLIIHQKTPANDSAKAKF